MSAVFRDHVVICGWNKRAKAVLENLIALTRRPILIIHTEIDRLIADVGRRPGVFMMHGDASVQAVLERADVAAAYSVLVLALDHLGASADARSVQIALAVERIRTAVYTVVELRDIQNKAHFAWTKVDDLVTDQEIAVRVIAQAIRHVTDSSSAASQHERKLLSLYQQLIDPKNSSSQIFRVDLDWEKYGWITFKQIMSSALPLGILPLAPVGFRKHRQPKLGRDEHVWTSWKSDVLSAPPPETRLKDIWPQWPSDHSPLGLLVIARSREHAERILSVLQSIPQV